MERSGLMSAQPISLTPVPSGVMQRCACGGESGLTGECAACRQKREGREGALQRRAAGPKPVADVPPMVHDVLRSPGQPLDSQTRAFMEPRFGHDFSNVRIHSDPAASASARAVQAHAYTVGQHVVFGADQYQPRTGAGLHLLAHELTHTVQQRTGVGGTVHRLSIGTEQSPLEQEATLAARRVLSGFTPQVTRSSAGVVQRTASASKCKPDNPKAYPVYWPILFFGPPPVNKFQRGTLVERDEDEAWQARVELYKRQNYDKEFWAKDYDVHHVLPLFLGGGDDLTPFTKGGNGVVLPRIVHRPGHTVLRIQPQMKTPPAGLPPLSTDMLRHPVGTPYEIIGVKEFKEDIEDEKCQEQRERERVKVPVPLPLGVPEGQEKPVPVPQPKNGPVTVPDGKPVPMPNPDVKPDAKPVSVPDDGGGKVLPFKPKPKPDAAPVPDSDALPIAAMVTLATGALWALSRQGAKRAGGAAVGKALVYAEMAAALVLVMFYSNRAEAKPGPGDSALEGLFKAMSQQGTPIPAELRQKIESDPKLKKLLESAASGQDISAAQAELNRQMAEEINAHLDEFSQEDLELLLQTTGSIQTNPKTAPTIETIKKAIEAKKNGASGTGKGGGSGSAVKDQAPKDPVDHPQAKDTSSLAPKPDARPKPVSPSPVDRLVAGMASPSADGPQMTSTLRARLLALASATVPPLTDEDVTTLLQHLVSAKGKTEDEIFNSVQQGIQGLRQSKGQTTSTDPMEKNTNADFVENQSAKGSATPTPGTKTVSHDEFIKKMVERITTYSGWSKISIESGIMKRNDGQSFSTVKSGETIQVEYYEYRTGSNRKPMRGTANLTISVKSLNKINKTMDITVLTKNSLIVIEDGSTKPMEISGGTIKLY